jgi:ABC-type dipeptide/oligopeptide/nickel transport system permease subunit
VEGKKRAVECFPPELREVVFCPMPGPVASNPDRNAWRRLRRNKGALAGLIVIAASLLVAASCYLIAPDKTPNANRMVVEISGQKPGFTQQFLKIPRGRKIEDVSLLQQIISGKEDKYQYMPISGCEMKGDSVIVQRYIDEGVSERMSYSRGQLQMNLENKQPVETIKFRLGSDKYGRDILSRLLVGVRVSLAVGLVTVLISLSLGVLLGALAGYYRGRVDDVVMWFINVIWSIPTLLLVFAITLVLGKGFWQVFIAIGLTLWVNVARIIRGQILSIRELEYVEAARALGFAGTRIITRHILPNVMGPVLVVAASNFATAIVIEAGLSFLGVGVQPPQPSWGLMIKENYNFIITHNPMLAIAPGIAIMLLVLAFNLLGNGMRDALEVRS